MANGGVVPGSSWTGTSPSYGVVGGIPTIEVKGIPIKQPTLWDSFMAGVRRTTGTLFQPAVNPNAAVAPETRYKTPAPANVGEQLAPLLALALAAGGLYMIWKAVK